MAAALFAGAASGGRGKGVNLLSTFASMASSRPASRAAAAPAQISSSDLYKALGTGLLGVAAVAERCVIRFGSLPGFVFLALFGTQRPLCLSK